MNTFEYDLVMEPRALLGLVVLQSDETIEQEARQVLPSSIDLLVSRVPSGAVVTPETLKEMEDHISDAAALFPHSAEFDASGYACTSGTSVIGPARVAELMRSTTSTRYVTEPVSALVAACQRMGLRKLGFLSPYVETVSDTLRAVLLEQSIETPVFGSFDEAEEARVTRIAAHSVHQAAVALSKRSDELDAVFLSCTNLRTFSVLEDIESEIGLPVLSSNLCLLQDMLLATGHGIDPAVLPCALTKHDGSAAL
ncbi:MAG: Asp/Glu racemase [Pseudomonadota bacterium]